MPTYEYQREDGSTFEAWQRMSDPPLESCPETGQSVKRVMSGGAGLIFKGSGFYLTDYARKPDGSSAKSEPAAEASSAKVTSDATDTSGPSSGEKKVSDKKVD